MQTEHILDVAIVAGGFLILALGAFWVHRKGLDSIGKAVQASGAALVGIALIALAVFRPRRKEPPIDTDIPEKPDYYAPPVTTQTGQSEVILEVEKNEDEIRATMSDDDALFDEVMARNRESERKSRTGNDT